MIICPPGKSPPVFFLPVVVDENGVIDPRVLFSDEAGHVRQRRGCFVEVTHMQQHSEYFVAIEGGTIIQLPVILDVEKAEVKTMLKKMLRTLCG